MQGQQQMAGQMAGAENIGRVTKGRGGGREQGAGAEAENKWQWAAKWQGKRAKGTGQEQKGREQRQGTTAGGRGQ